MAPPVQDIQGFLYAVSGAAEGQRPRRPRVISVRVLAVLAVVRSPLYCRVLCPRGPAHFVLAGSVASSRGGGPTSLARLAVPTRPRYFRLEVLSASALMSLTNGDLRGSTSAVWESRRSRVTGVFC
ncbi:hypothetical protein NDU88_003655 [Pleurodeles waltl]|uniref:Uncharacterized protein n=1 Tax=Pleurodeles waltl TaxID=8319 RepID=A0AAV7TQB8_PLEWA|nr:hypothetical protein NDU88_003655 [Pleurodeles waltl]